MRNQSVLFFTDNQSLVSVINKQTSKDAELVSFVRTMVLVCLQNNNLLKAKHLPGRRNVLADRFISISGRPNSTIGPGIACVSDV